MSTTLKMFFDDMPDSVPIPSEFQHKQVELILLAEAAIAITNSVILVTHNTGEFTRISGLSLEDWETQ